MTASSRTARMLVSFFSKHTDTHGTYSSLRPCTQFGLWEMALDVLNQIRDMANVITYNSVLHALCMGGACDQAVELLNRMKTEGRVDVREGDFLKSGHFCGMQQEAKACHCLVRTEARDLPYWYIPGNTQENTHPGRNFRPNFLQTKGGTSSKSGFFGMTSTRYFYIIASLLVGVFTLPFCRKN